MKKLLSLLFLAALLFSCNKSEEINIDGNPQPTADDVVVQNFMWQAMNLWYFWQQDVPDLADDRFSTDEEYTQFLAATPDPEQFFYQICNKHKKVVGDAAAVDRFSFFEEDYTDLVNNLNGISKSNGLDFGLRLFSGSEDIFGYVRYIIPGSNASTKAIERGDLFTRVDGQTLNLSNYRDLLFSGNDTYTLTLAEIQGDTVVETGEEVSLTKEENLAEDPIFIAETFDVNGTKVAYLMYNAFTSDFDTQLNDTFGQFIAEGATELILDLRYNSGGSVISAQYLSSMIYGPNTQDVFIRSIWNDKLQDILGNEQKFVNEVEGQSINSMNLNKVYIITTGSSASASELVINGLAPYVEIVQIGETTRGKNEFSITMVDDPDRDGAPFIYTPSRESEINPDNSWALQPLVGRNENAVGFSDYTDGLAPTIALEEDLANLGVLGDPNEPLLARALQEFSGTSSKFDFEVKMPAKPFTDSKMFKPLRDNMVLEINF